MTADCPRAWPDRQNGHVTGAVPSGGGASGRGRGEGWEDVAQKDTGSELDRNMVMSMGGKTGAKQREVTTNGCKG